MDVERNARGAEEKRLAEFTRDFLHEDVSEDETSRAGHRPTVLPRGGPMAQPETRHERMPRS